jgi:hypothetical protein
MTAGPAAWAAYVVIGVAVVAVAVSVGLCVRFLVRPGEREPDHIKRRVLEPPSPPTSS